VLSCHADGIVINALEKFSAIKVKNPLGVHGAVKNNLNKMPESCVSSVDFAGRNRGASD
jgi:hypothetical protein